jgi:PEP-CTERM motif
MPNINKQTQRLIPALVLALALSPLAFCENALALPSSPVTSGAPGGPNPEHGYYQLGYNHGPDLSGGHSNWTSWESYYSEISENEWDNYDDGYDGDDDGNTSPVPEPTSALLLSLGLAGAAYLKRRRK